MKKLSSELIEIILRNYYYAFRPPNTRRNKDNNHPGNYRRPLFIEILNAMEEDADGKYSVFLTNEWLNAQRKRVRHHLNAIAKFLIIIEKYPEGLKISLTAVALDPNGLVQIDKIREELEAPMRLERERQKREWERCEEEHFAKGVMGMNESVKKLVALIIQVDRQGYMPNEEQVTMIDKAFRDCSDNYCCGRLSFKDSYRSALGWLVPRDDSTEIAKLPERTDLN
jgi:hypothetical protein